MISLFVHSFKIFFNACLRVLQDMRTKIYNKIIQTNFMILENKKLI